MPSAVKDLFARSSSLCAPLNVDRQVSPDGTRKYVLRLHDDVLVETVGIPHGDAHAPRRLTVCYSTQAGCAMGCAFCATGTQGLVRNLSAAEMVWQVMLVGHDFGCPVTSTIAMGQGEPLANHDALIEALRVMGHSEGLGISADDLVISTCGLPEGIHALASGAVDTRLAVSLHAARQELRDRLMPGVRSFTLDRLHDELSRYCRDTGRGIIVQYLMLEGVNDSGEDLDALVRFCSGLDAFVVLLRYNRVDGIPFAPSAYGRLAMWCLMLRQRGIEAKINQPRGADIDAACGQLRNRFVGLGEGGSST